jgi:hypothetical protein
VSDKLFSGMNGVGGLEFVVFCNSIVKSELCDALCKTSYNICLFALYRVFKKSFTTLKGYINLSRGHVQCFEMSI